MCAKDDVYVKYDSLKVQTKLCLEIHCLCISLAFVFGRDVIVGMQKKGKFHLEMIFNFSQPAPL